MKKRNVAILIVAILLVAGIGVGVILAVNGKLKSSFSVSNADIEENTLKYEDNDYYYQNQDANLKFDEDTGIDYYNNVVTAFLTEDVSEKGAEELAESISGKLIGHISGSINEIQIMVKDSTLSELQSLSDQLMQSDKVLQASYDCPMKFEETDENADPWESDSDEHSDKNNDGDETNPDGNDWWAESIGAYSVWELVDSNIFDFSPVNIGIIDSGFDAEHEEFKTETGSKINFAAEYSDDAADDHGTFVSGLIGANHNSKGMRGVADESVLWCMNFKHAKSTTLSFSKAIDILISKDVKVFNCSYTEEYWCSEETFNAVKSSDSDETLSEEKAELKKYNDYNAYITGLKNSTEHSTQNAIGIIENLIINKKECLFVECAGNGYDNQAKSGYDTNWTGIFNGIDQESFDKYKETLSSEDKLKGISYEDIKNRVIVVSGYKKGEQSSIDSGFCYGENVDLCAPGRDIYSTLTTKDDVEGEYNNGLSYASESGTSFATPIVSGSAAVLWSFNNSLKASEVKDLLLSAADQGKSSSEDDKREKYSMLNLAASLYKELNGTIHLSIVDEDNNPISADSVEIKTDATDSEVFNYTYDYTDTAEEGQDLWLAALGNCTITIKKDGYETVTLEVSVKPSEDKEYGTVTLNEEVDLTDCISEYAELLLFGKAEAFCLAYVNNDNIPELITAERIPNHYNIPAMYTYHEGNVGSYQDNGNDAIFGSHNGRFTYAERTGHIIASGFENGLNSFDYFYTISKTQITEKSSFDYDFGRSATGENNPHRYIDQEEVTEDEYQSQLSEKKAEYDYRTISAIDMYEANIDNIEDFLDNPSKFVVQGELLNASGSQTNEDDTDISKSVYLTFIDIEGYETDLSDGNTYYGYVIRDVNADGQNELIIKTNNSSNGNTYYCYSEEDGYVNYIGKFGNANPPDTTVYYSNQKNGLVVTGRTAGVYNYEVYEIGSTVEHLDEYTSRQKISDGNINYLYYENHSEITEADWNGFVSDLVAIDFTENTTLEDIIG